MLTLDDAQFEKFLAAVREGFRQVAAAVRGAEKWEEAREEVRKIGEEAYDALLRMKKEEAALGNRMGDFPLPERHPDPFLHDPGERK